MNASLRSSLILVSLVAALNGAPAALAQSNSSQSESAAADASPRLRLRVAVDQFKWDEVRGHPFFDFFYNSINTDLRRGIQAALVEKLAASGHFQVMEREATAMAQMRVEDSIDLEKRMGQAGAAQVDSRQKRTPAQFIITPTVTGLQMTGDEGNGTRIMGVRVAKKKTSVTLTLNIRISDAQTSALLASATAVGTQESTEKKVDVIASGLPVPPIPGVGRLFGSRGGNVEVNNSKKESAPFFAVVESALQDAVQKIVARLSSEPWSAVVAAKDPSTGRLIINAGSEAGVTVGSTFDVMKAGGVVLDPDTGDVLTRGDESKIGKIRVARVERNVAYCDVVDGSAFEPKNIIRIAAR